MANGVLALSKYAEYHLLDAHIARSGLLPISYKIFFNVIYGLQSPPNTPPDGYRTLRLRLCSSCNPLDITGLNYTELSGNGYPAQPPQVIFEPVTGESYQASNKYSVSFGPATADWAPITHVIVTAIVHGGDPNNAMLLWHAFPTPITVTSGNSLVFPVGGLKLSMS